jgi:hypothetical protein
LVRHTVIADGRTCAAETGGAHPIADTVENPTPEHRYAGGFEVDERVISRLVPRQFSPADLVIDRPTEGQRSTSNGSYLFTPARNTAGRASALTVLSPLPRRWIPLERGILRIRRALGPDPRVERMSFIHFAHWLTISHFPGEERPTRYGYLLFVSNFNGVWGKYIEAFSRVIPKRMALLWGACFGFPGVLPPRPFRSYIQRNDTTVDHYYCAYPDASATEVAAALRVSEEFRREAAGLADPDAATFGPAWRRFIEAAQRDL